MTDLSSLLNAEQFEAATAPDGPLLILAAAGTGKTRTLVYRVVHLIERGVDPRAIILLTFTNRAAREMIERANVATLGISSGIWGGTFHHVANRILRRFGSKIKYSSDFAILDSDDQKSVMATCIKSVGFNAKDFTKREVVLSLISGAVNRGYSLETYLDINDDKIETAPEDIISVANAYAMRKREINAMDFDDLLKNALTLLQDHDEVREYYQTRFNHILVDEYQDTNIIQSSFVDILAERHRNLSVVGDDFQCIYSWRGSNYQNIIDFPKRYSGTRIIKLEQNYRSRPEILEVANASIRHNPNQFEKQLRATCPSQGIKPIVYNVFSDVEQSDEVMQIISNSINAGYSYNDIAILYRSHFHSIDVQMKLTRSGVSYSITSGLSFFEQAHAKDIIALFRLVEFPSDRLSFDRVMGLMKGMGPATIEKIWTKLGGVFEAGNYDHRSNLLNLIPEKLRPQWEPIDKIIAKYKNSGDANAPGIFIEQFIYVFYEAYLKRSFDNPDDRMDDLKELAADMGRNKDIKSFLAEVSLLTNVDLKGQKRIESEGEENKPRVLLSTIHQAKGLEWPVVILLWMVEDMFPSAKSVASDNDDTEERRLFYVAVTRTRDRLHMITPSIRHMYDGGVMSCDPSRFISEIRSDLYTSTNRVRKYSGYDTHKSRGWR